MVPRSSVFAADAAAAGGEPAERGTTPRGTFTIVSKCEYGSYPQVFSLITGPLSRALPATTARLSSPTRQRAGSHDCWLFAGKLLAGTTLHGVRCPQLASTAPSRAQQSVRGSKQKRTPASGHELSASHSSWTTHGTHKPPLPAKHAQAHQGQGCPPAPLIQRRAPPPGRPPRAARATPLGSHDGAYRPPGRRAVRRGDGSARTPRGSAALARGPRPLGAAHPRGRALYHGARRRRGVPCQGAAGHRRGQQRGGGAATGAAADGLRGARAGGRV
jgi:hypothetical protein